MRLRPAAPGDIPALAGIAAASYRASFGAILGEEGLALRDAAHFAERFAAEWPAILVAADASGAVLGFAEVRQGVLDMLFVAPGRAGGGIGAALLAAAEARGAARLECFRDNARARAFYARHGWRETAAYEREFAGRLHAFVCCEKP